MRALIIGISGQDGAYLAQLLLNKGYEVYGGSRDPDNNSFDKLVLLGILINIKRDWGWAPEYVDAMWRMLQQPKPGDYVIGTGESQTLEKFVQTSFELVNLDWRDHVVYNPNLFRPSDLQTSYCNP